MWGRFASRTRSPFHQRQISNVLPKSNQKSLLFAGVAAVSASAALYAMYARNTSDAFGYVEECLDPGHFPWYHKVWWHSYDHAAIRRGFRVYDQIGKACHGMKFIYYRQLVNVAYTEDEMRAIAAENEGYKTKPNDEGDVEERTGLLTDNLWEPFDNEKAARAGNNGALPPDLTVIVRARHHGEDYLFCLLTGYRDPPHGITLGPNMYYNLYFPGNQLSMPPPLAAGAVEYDDGTEASVSQMAKDVTTYLAWSSEMERDERHLMGLKTLFCTTALLVPFYYWKKSKWSVLKKRSVEFLRRRKED
jgi:ubiquinol-cytochrome c reductase cytochrome c1 subunit